MADGGGALPVPEGNKKDIWLFDSASDTQIASEIGSLYVFFFLLRYTLSRFNRWAMN